MKTILNNTFNQLIIIYTLLVLTISLGFLSKYTLQFHILAVILAIIGITSIKENNSNKTHYYILAFAILAILALRIIPYINNSTPLGYDSGIYKYGIETNYLDNWILQGAFEPGFLYLMQFLHLFIPTNIILTYVLILFTLALGLVIYKTTEIYSNKTAALISILLYAFSLIQFKTYTYMYYKNIIALTTALLTLYLIKKDNKLFILTAVLTGIIHRPTFYILGLSYLVFTITKLKTKELKKYFLAGIIILVLTSLFYLGKFQNQILMMFDPVLQGFTQPGESPGTFIDFNTYLYSTLAYLPLAILGFIHFIKKKEYNLITIWALLAFIIVYFQFFFFNRFIIMLDIALIILAAIGFTQIKIKYIAIITILLIVSAGIITTKEALNSPPLITNEELQAIQYLQTTEDNAYVMSTNSLYSPYVLGYSTRKTIAPGLFDYNQHNKEQWITFWTTNDLEQVKSFLNVYQKPLYIFIGSKQQDNLQQYNECFNLEYNQNNNKVYQYTC